MRACLCVVMHSLPKVQSSATYECPYRQLLAVHCNTMPALQTLVHHILHRTTKSPLMAM